MKATIELGRNPRAFWSAALAMCEEHLRFYARENAFRANVRMFQAMCDAHNAGNGQALHYGSLAAVGGLSPAVRQCVADSMGEEVAMSAAQWGSLDFVHGGGDPGFWFAVDPDKDGSVYASWTTSSGNVLSLRLQGEWAWATVEGRRHGIPWRFLDNCGLSVNDLLVVGMESETTSKPWENGSGETLWEPKGEARKFEGNPKDLAEPLEEYPDWGDCHQQAGWAADRVYTWSKLGGVIRSCAALGAPSGAVEEVHEDTWPYRTFVRLAAGILK